MRVAGVPPRRAAECALALAVPASFAAAFAAYVLTPHEVEMHMQTSAGRVLVLPHVLLLVLAVLRLASVLELAGGDRLPAVTEDPLRSRPP